MLGTPRPFNGRQLRVLAGVVVHFAEVEEYVALVGIQLDVDALLAQFCAVADVLQTRSVVAEDGE